MSNKKQLTKEAFFIDCVLAHAKYSGSRLNTQGPTESARKSMYNSAVMIPAVLFLPVSVLLRCVYPLGKKETDALQAEKEKILKSLD